MTTIRAIVRWDISLALNMTYNHLSALRATFPEGESKNVRHIERMRNIPPKMYGAYTLHLSRGILHCVHNGRTVESAAVATRLRNDK